MRGVESSTAFVAPRPVLYTHSDLQIRRIKQEYQFFLELSRWASIKIPIKIPLAAEQYSNVCTHALLPCGRAGCGQESPIALKKAHKFLVWFLLLQTVTRQAC